MKYSYKIRFAFFLLLVSALSLQVCAQENGSPAVFSIGELAEQFKSPPPEYGPTVTWGWQGPVDHSVIDRDLDSLQALGFRMVTIEGGYKMTYPYLSPGYFQLINYAVAAAKKRGMRVWIIDEGKYPSGFAGGLFSKERPDLRMRALIPIKQIKVSAGETIRENISSHVLSAIAYNKDTSELLPVTGGEIVWFAPQDQGDWTIVLAGYAFRTSPTRSANNPTGAKDTRNSLCDYLDPEATRQFIAFTHEQYKKYIGGEFGKTVIGFRSDEPAYSYIPWTPDMLQEFRQQKGYDVQPYLASFFIRHPSLKAKRIRADYWEVFSNLFRDHFFKIISDWCVKNNLQYEGHLDHDGPEDGKTMLALARSEGDYFKDMRYFQIPGIDVIWHQLWPGEANNFPKLASSAAHLFGRRQAFSESFAAYRPRPGIQQVAWILNEQLVRGINLFEIMFYAASTGERKGPHGFMAAASFPSVMRALNRKAYVLANGKPVAKIGLFFPTSSLWLKDTIANDRVWHIAQQLLNHQRDFDFVDEQSLASLMKLKGGRFVNLSGQTYGAIIVPPVKVLSEKVLLRLKTFADDGGKVIFMGRLPSLLKTKTFAAAIPFPGISWATIASTTGNITPKILSTLPEPDVRLSESCPAIKYLHRHFNDGEIYFFFNESDEPQTRTATIKGNGLVQVWNPKNGEIAAVKDVRSSNGFVRMPLTLAPYEARIVVVRRKSDKN